MHVSTAKSVQNGDDGDEDDMMDQGGKKRTPEELGTSPARLPALLNLRLETMSVISDMRSKANNKARHRPEFQARSGVNVNGARVFARLVTTLEGLQFY